MSLLHLLLVSLVVDLVVCLVAMWVFAPWWCALPASLPLVALMAFWALARTLPND